MPVRPSAVVLATSSIADRELFVQRLRSRNLSVWSIPVTHTRIRRASVNRLARVCGAGRRFDWLVVTSRRAGEVIGQLPPALRVAAVGPATAASLEARGIEVDLVPFDKLRAPRASRGVGTVSGGRALARSILRASPKRPLRCLWPRAAGADRALARHLRLGGSTVCEIAVYETRPRPLMARARIERSLATGRIRAVCFFAPSGVRAFVRQLSAESRTALTKTSIASFGASTTAELRRHGLRPAIETSSGHAGDFADAIAAATEPTSQRNAR